MKKTRKQYRETGERYGCEKISKEAAETAVRWEEDLDVLRKYGKGRVALDKFNVLRNEHTSAMNARSEGVAAKLSATARAHDTHEKADEFIDMATDILEGAGDDNAEIEKALNAALSSLEGKAALMTRLGSLLRTYLAELPEDCDAEELANRGDQLVLALETLLPSKASTRASAKEDTEDLDVLDGRLVDMIAKINRSGRKAFRHLGNKTKVEEYKYHHLAGSVSSSANVSDGTDQQKQ